MPRRRGCAVPPGGGAPAGGALGPCRGSAVPGERRAGASGGAARARALLLGPRSPGLVRHSGPGTDFVPCTNGVAVIPARGPDSCRLRTGLLPGQRRGRRGPSGRGAGRDFTLSRRGRISGEVAAACHIPSTYSPGSYLSPTRGGGGAAASRGFSDLRTGFVLRDETSCRRPSRAPLGSGRVAAEHDTGSPALASRAAQRSGRAAAVPDPP